MNPTTDPTRNRPSSPVAVKIAAGRLWSAASITTRTAIQGIRLAIATRATAALSMSAAPAPNRSEILFFSSTVVIIDLA